MQLQNVNLLPLDLFRDDVSIARESVSHTNVQRTLLGSAVKDKRKAIHQAHRLKQLSRKERRELLHA